MDQPTSKEPRGPVSLRIKFRSANLDQFIERYAVDVSRGGIFIRTREPLAVGTQLRFDFQLQDAAPLLAGEGTIVWIRENDPSRAGVTPGMGVRFDKLTAASQPTLDKILAEKARREQSGGLAKPGPASGMAVRRPSSTFSALDPEAVRAAAPPRVGGLSPLGAAPRAPAPATGSGPVGAQPRTAAAATGSGAVAGAQQPRSTAPAGGSDPFGARSAAPSGVAPESSGAFGRPRSTTGMNAMRPAPAPSSLFEKPSAEDIDRALSVLTEVDGAAPVPVPTPVDFSSRVRKPTDAQPMIVEALPDVGDAPKAPHRRPTDAQPMVLESSPDVGNAPARPKTDTQPFFTGAATGETRAKTVPVTPLGDIANEPLHDEEEEDDATSAWVGSGPTRVGEDQPIPAAARGPKADEALAQAPTVVAKLGEGRLGEAKSTDAKAASARPVEPPPRRPSSPSLPAAAPPPPPSLAAEPRPVAPSAPPAIMAPNFAAEALPTAKKKGSGGVFTAVTLVLLAAGGGAAWYFIKGPGHALLVKSGATVESNAPVLTAEGTAPAQPTAAPAEPEKAAAEKPANAEAKQAEAKPGEKPTEAKPAEAKPAEAKPAEAKAEGKPSEPKAEGKPHKKRRGGGSEAAAEPKPAEAAPAVADVSPKASEAAAKPEGEAAKPAGDTEAAKPAGGGHVLKITSSPTGAEVIVDGTSMGTTPFSTGDVDPALPHSVTIKKDGFEAYEHMIGGSDWPRPKGGVRTLKLSAKLRSTGGAEPPKPAESDTPAGEPPPGLGTTPASPKRE